VNPAAGLRLRLDCGRTAHPSWYLNPGLLLDTTMTNTEARGSKTTDSSDWNHAWSVVSQLAEARGTALRELGQDDRAAAPSAGIDASLRDATLAPNAAAPPTPPFAPVVSDQLARDIAEIEQAAAALRRAEPTLEPRAPEMPPGIEPRVSHSVWPLVCVIWLTAAMVVSCAIGAVVLLVG
jgi:hypothetical protein